jgi:predicted phosphodiesterase
MKTGPFRVLVLSDIHFGSWSHYKCDFPGTVTEPEDWAARLLNELDSCLKPPSVLPSPPYDSIVLNGDVTSLCEDAGFAATRSLISGLVKRGYVRKREKVLFLPGNHDVKRSSDGLPLPRKEREAVFRKEYQNCLGVKNQCDDHLGVLHIFPKPKIALIGLDSCRIEGSDNPGIGYIGFDQLDSLVSTLEKREADEGPYRRIAFVHHHVETPAGASPDWISQPAEERQFSFTADSKRIKEGLLVLGIDCLIHGHYHTPELSLEANKRLTAGRIISAGSVAGALSRCFDKIRQFMLFEVTDTRFLIYDCRKKGANDWIPCCESFPLHRRSSIDSSERIRIWRGSQIYESVSQMNRYREWVTAARFFAGDREALAGVKKKVLDSEAWSNSPDAFKAAWAELPAYLAARGEDARRRYAKQLNSPDARNLAAFVSQILKRLKP